MATTRTAHAGRNRARDARLTAARERRVLLDPERVARDRRIDDAVVDAEIAWETRAAAEQAIAASEIATGEAVRRLLAEGISLKDAAGLTGMDQRTLRRLRGLASYDGAS